MTRVLIRRVVMGAIVEIESEATTIDGLVEAENGVVDVIAFVFDVEFVSRLFFGAEWVIGEAEHVEVGDFEVGSVAW